MGIGAVRSALTHDVATLVGVCLVLGGGWVILCNWLYLALNLRNQRLRVDRYYSFVPLVGPMLTMPGLALLVGVKFWILATWLVDFGTPVFVASLPALAREFRRR